MRERQKEGREGRKLGKRNLGPQRICGAVSGLSWPHDMAFEKIMYAAMGKGLKEIMMRYRDDLVDAWTLLYKVRFQDDNWDLFQG